MRVQFSTQHLLVATSLVALAIGGCFWVKTLLGIDPNSETVLVADEAINAKWKNHDWQLTTGMHLHSTQFASVNWNGGAKVRIQQRLLTIAYKNYIGQEVYRANVYLDGYRTDDWSEYLLMSRGTGGGITAGGTSVTCEYTAGTSTLKVVAIQYLNPERRAKRLELVFERVGDIFIQRTDIEQRFSDQPGE